MFDTIYTKFLDIVESLQAFAILLIRWVLAYGFFEPAMTKWSDISSVAEWFSSLGIPMPLLNAYLAATTEMLGVGLLFLGLFTRFISLALINVMVVAIFTVHFANGFSAGNNGFEIPLYYLLMLFILVTHGASRYSLDFILWNNK